MSGEGRVGQYIPKLTNSPMIIIIIIIIMLFSPPRYWCSASAEQLYCGHRVGILLLLGS